MKIEIEIEQKFMVLTEAVVTSTVQRAAQVALENLLFKHQDAAQYLDAATHGFLLPSNAPPISSDLLIKRGEN